MNKFKHSLAFTLSASLIVAVLLTGCLEKSIDEEKMVDAIVAQISQSKPDQPMPEGFRELITSDIRMNKLIADAARQEKLDKDDGFKATLELQTMQLLSTKYFEKKLKDFAPTDEALKSMYDKEVSRMKLQSETANKEYNLRHILVKTEDQAKSIATKLAAGEAFETLAKESIDPSAASNGGQLGWGPLSQWVPEFGEAASVLKVGEYSAPVKSQFGYHIIQLMDAPRTIKGTAAQAMPEIPPFEQVKDSLREMAKSKHIEELRSAFKERADAIAAAQTKK